MSDESSPRPWRVDGIDISDANGEPVTPLYFNEQDEANAALIVDAVNERDRLRDALNEVCRRVSVALSCPRHETEAIDLLVHDLLGIDECARAVIGEGKP